MIGLAEQLILDGIQEGRLEGIQEGIQKGIQEGIQKERKALICKALEMRFGSVPQSIIDAIEANNDEFVLDSLFKLAIDAETLADFEKEL